MPAYTVIFSPEAEAQLVELYGYIATKASPEIAAGFTDGIVAYCESLTTFPLRGVLRDDVRPGLRMTNFRKRVAIAFDVEGDRVTILGIFYGGQNYETALLDNEEE
jgi:plasmid stabilization system protein ParE